MDQARIFSQLPRPILTAYLNSNPASRSRRNLVPAYLIWLKTRAKRIAESLAGPDRDLFQQQAGRIGEFLRQYVPPQPGLLLFSGPATWEIVPLPFEVNNELNWGKPALAQLFWILCEQKAYGAAVVHRSGVRYYRYQFGEMTELGQKKFQIDVSRWRRKDLGHVARPGIRKTRGSQRDVFEHRMEAQYRRICHGIAGTLKDLAGREKQAATFLVGPGRLTQCVQKGLPQDLRRNTVLIDQLPVKASAGDLQQRLETGITKWEAGRVAELLDSLFGNKPAAVIGVDETLARLQQNGIRILIVAENLDADVQRCTACGWIDRSADPVCSRCGGTRQREKLRAALPELAQAFDVDVEVVAGPGAERLEKAGGLAGWLRRSETTAFKEAAASKT